MVCLQTNLTDPLIQPNAPPLVFPWSCRAKTSETEIILHLPFFIHFCLSPQEENNQSWVSAHVLPNGQALIASRKYSSSTCPPSGEWLGESLVKCLNPSVDTCLIMNTDRSQSCPRNGKCFNTLKSFECDQEPETVLGCDHIQIR